MNVEQKLGSLKNDCARILSHADSVCLWLSGGADSLLLLHAMAKTNLPFGILRFDDAWSRRQKETVNAVIRSRNLTVFSYPPVSYFLFGEEDNLTFAAFYAVDQTGASVPIMRDVVPGTRCAFDIEIEPPKTTAAPIAFDVHVVGTRREDRHYSFGSDSLFKTAETAIGSKTFRAPLFDWNNTEVIEALSFLGVDYVKPVDDAADTGNIAACSLCLTGKEKVLCPKTEKEINPVAWDGRANLDLFQQIILRNKQ